MFKGLGLSVGKGGMDSHWSPGARVWGLWQRMKEWIMTVAFL